MTKERLAYLHELEEAFVKLYQHGRYAEAVNKARHSLSIAAREVPPGHPYLKVLQNNLQCALRKYRETTWRPPDASELTGRTGARVKQTHGWFAVLCLLLAVLLSGFTALNYGLNKTSPPYPQTARHVVNGNYAAAGGNYFHHSYRLKEKAILEVPVISQNPELPRGCEVTSLAMLLHYAGIMVDKMTLAEEIEKEPAFYRNNDGQIYRGNPYYGFVGSMYKLSDPGYGAYHGPVRKLMEKYLPGKTIDLTGCDFQDILLFISEGVPVWVVANVLFKELEDADFQTWHTKQGPVKITYREHAVLLTGYDEESVYFNDTLDSRKNKKAARSSFQAAWEQMGAQGVTYLPY